MKWATRILVLLLLVGGWAVAARCVHLIHSTDVVSGQDRFFILPKARWRFAETYVDVRSWTPADLSSHAELVRHIVASKRSDLLAHVVPESSRADAATWLINAIDHPPATQPTP